MIAKAAKAEKVVALHTKFVDAKAAILADYSGLNVQQLAELRSQLRTAAVELHVVKNTLARRAVVRLCDGGRDALRAGRRSAAGGQGR